MPFLNVENLSGKTLIIVCAILALARRSLDINTRNSARCIYCERCSTISRPADFFTWAGPNSRARFEIFHTFGRIPREWGTRYHHTVRT